MSYFRIGDTARDLADDLNPWSSVPDEVAVEWDRDVAPHLDGMPEGTRLYWRADDRRAPLGVRVLRRHDPQPYRVEKRGLDKADGLDVELQRIFRRHRTRLERSPCNPVVVKD